MAGYLDQEDGTSKIILEDGTGDLLLEDEITAQGQQRPVGMRGPRRAGPPVVVNQPPSDPTPDGGVRRVTQAPVEVVTHPTNPNARTTQNAVEVTTHPTNPNARITQAVVEVPLRVLNPKARVTQNAVEVVTKVQHEIVAIVWVDG